MSTALAPRNGADIIERVLLAGDLKNLTPAERVTYYSKTCESLGLNPLTQPFEYIVLNSKLTLYAKRNAADQLRKIHGVSIDPPHSEVISDTYIVTVTGRDATGRVDSEIGAVSIKGLGGEALANAMMKATTKAKRRLTLSIVGLGWLDETEISSVPDAQVVTINHETGEITEQPKALAGPTGNGQYERDQRDYTRFWSRAKGRPDAGGLGLTDKRVHEILGVASIKDVPDLNAAMATLEAHVTAAATPAQAQVIEGQARVVEGDPESFDALRAEAEELWSEYNALRSQAKAVGVKLGDTLPLDTPADRLRAANTMLGDAIAQKQRALV